MKDTANIASGTVENGEARLSLSGRIDSANAAQAETEIFGIFAGTVPAAVLIDAENLAYISSAGLRILLKLKKLCKNVKVINVSPEVYDVFQVTGFSEMLTVEKAFRRIDVAGCPEIGRGAFGTVYRLSPDTIVKVYENGRGAGLDFIRREQETSKKAFVYGLPTAISFDVVRVGENYGVVYEMLDAVTLGAYITQHPDEMETMLQKTAALAKKIHATEVPEDALQPASSIFSALIPQFENYISEEALAHYRALIAVFPSGTTMIHGDFHPKNIMVRNGELELIDMGDVSRGCPLLEFRSMYVLYNRIMTYPDQAERMAAFMGTNAEIGIKVWPAFIRCYFGDRLTEENNALLTKSLDIISLMVTVPPMVARVMASNMTPETKKARIDGSVKSLLSIDPAQASVLFEKTVQALFH